MSNINQDDYQIQQYTYNFVNKVLLSNGEIYDISNSLKTIQIINDLTINVMPIYIIKYEMQPNIMQKIQNDSDKVLFTLESYIIGTRTTTSSTYDKYMEPVTLKPVILDKEPINVKDTTREYNSSYQSERFEMVAVPSFMLDVNKYIVSGNLINCTITEAILALTSRLNNIKTNLVPPDNQLRYKQVLLIPSNIITNIKYIADNYGIYNDPLKIFMQNNKLFIGPINAARSYTDGNIHINVRIPIDKDDKLNFTPGSYMTNDSTGKIKNYIVYTKLTNITISNYDEMYTELYGNNNYYLHYNLTGGEKYYFYHRNREDRNGKLYKTKVYRNEFNNLQTLNMLRKNLTDSTALSYTFTNLNLSPENIFKIVNLYIDNPNYNGKFDSDYYITRSVFRFTINSNASAAQTGVLYLRKSTDLENTQPINLHEQ